MNKLNAIGLFIVMLVIVGGIALTVSANSTDINPTDFRIQCKVFHGQEQAKIQKDINKWLVEKDVIRLDDYFVKVLQSESMSELGYNLTITIFYKDYTKRR